LRTKVSSRFDQTWNFRDYTNDELLTILERYAAESEYELIEGCMERVLEILEQMPRDRHFGPVVDLARRGQSGHSR